MKKKILFTSLFLCSILTFVNSQILDFKKEFSSPEITISHQNDNRKIDFREVDPVLAEELLNVLYVQKESIGAVGLAATLIFPNDDVWEGATGKNSVSGDSLTADMLFGVGSVTKTITASCIMSLKEEGLLSLDDSLFEWLPSYPNIDSTITIRQLMNHTSGIFNYTGHPEISDSVYTDPSRIWEPDEILNYFVLEPNFVPGTDWDYSNTNYILLGLIIETVTGNTYAEEVRNRFLTPLGLSKIFLCPQEEPDLPIAHMWEDILNTGSPIDLEIISTFSRNGLFSMAWSAGAYLSDPAEIARWMRFLFKGNALSPELVEEMKDWVYINSSISYGLGIAKISYEGQDFYGHSGEIGYKSAVFYSPDEDICLSVVTNDGTSDDLQDVLIALWNVYKTYTGVDEIAGNQPAFDVFPNPFNDKISISFGLQSNTKVKISLFNALGKTVEVIENEEYTQGEYHVDFELNRSKIIPGFYFLKFEVGDRVEVVKIVKQ